LGSRARHPAAAERDQYYADIAASVQKVTEEILLRMARAAVARTGMRHLVMAGGVALNSVANGRIQDEAGSTTFMFSRRGRWWGCFGGRALGLAYGAGAASIFVQHASWAGRPRGRNPHRFVQYGHQRHPDEVEDELVERAASDLLGCVLGWSQGRFDGARGRWDTAAFADPRQGGQREGKHENQVSRDLSPFAPSLLWSGRPLFRIAAGAPRPQGHAENRSRSR